MKLKKNLDGYTPSCPAPFLRVRVGDRITFHLKNNENSIFPHSIDLRAVNGPGGGATMTQLLPVQFI